MVGFCIWIWSNVCDFMRGRECIFLRGSDDGVRGEGVPMRARQWPGKSWIPFEQEISKSTMVHGT